MNGRCNRIWLDTAALFQDITACAMDGLMDEGNRLVNLMRSEVHRTMDGGAPGKPSWRDEIARSLGHVATAVTDDAISMDFGYSPSGEADGVRALVVAYGSGDKAEGGGKKITAGPPGRNVWDGDLAGKHPSRAKSTYPLPDGFNQQGNQFVRNAMRKMRTEYGNRLEPAFGRLLKDAVYKRVKVRSP